MGEFVYVECLKQTYKKENQLCVKIVDAEAVQVVTDEIKFIKNIF